MRKGAAREGTPKATERGLRMAVPEAGGDGRRGGCAIGQDRPGHEGQFGQALAGLGGVDERAGGPEHLLGRQGELFDCPAVAVEVAQHRGADGERRGEEQRFPVARVVHGDHREGRTLRLRLSFRLQRVRLERQIGPDLRAQQDPVLLPGLDAVWRRGGDGPPALGARQGAHDLSARRGAATPTIERRGRAAERAVFGQAHYVARVDLLSDRFRFWEGISPRPWAATRSVWPMMSPITTL